MTFNYEKIHFIISKLLNFYELSRSELKVIKQTCALYNQYITSFLILFKLILLKTFYHKLNQ